jgi:hypothetical protein
MGYTTDFEGGITLNKRLSPDQINYLKTFSATRRVMRDPSKLKNMPDPVREAVGLPIGEHGCYYVGDAENYGQNDNGSVIDMNKPPHGQPGLWTQWVPTEDGIGIEWDGGEKFYYYVEWMKYLLEHFIKHWGLVANGEITWSGEDRDDMGKIIVIDNVVTVKTGKVFYQ